MTPLLPKPSRHQARAGTFPLKDLSLHAPEEAGRLVEPFLRELSATRATHPESATILLVRDELPPSLTQSDEGYLLAISEEKITLTAAKAAGWFYGLQSLLQLIAYESSQQHESPRLPCQVIEDAPAFGWRGLHLDVCRHFFEVDFIKKLLDLMALHKLNTFHWHLTEDQGWRIEIPSHPRLTEISAWRDEDGKRYGGYYTHEQIREVVQYAADRFITVVPEIELPGHALAALAAYPDLACQPRDFAVETEWGIFDDVYCAGNEATFDFLQDVLTETLSLFSSPVIHLGGDECPKTRWKTCPKCQARMKEENLSDEDELQSWFVSRIVRFLADQGRHTIGWDEILEGGLAPGALVMSWQGERGGIAAARLGHDVVMSPMKPCYFDWKQADADDEPGFHGVNLLHEVYHYQPIPAELTPEEAKHVLGGQANIWTERMTTPSEVEFMILPRLCALAEALWSTEERDWNSFQSRLHPHLERLTKLGYHSRSV